MKEKLAKVWGWLRDHAVVILGAIVAVLGAGWAWGYYKGKTRKLEDELAIERAHRKVAGLDARREALAQQEAVHVEEIKKLETERAAVVRSTVALDQQVHDLSDEEVERAFKDLY